MNKNEIAGTHIPEPRLSRLLFADTRFSLVWLAIRLYVGWIWFQAGIEKVQNPLWVGPKAGVALTGFIARALEKTQGAHPDVQMLYGDFLNNFVIGNAAFFGAFMNMNFLLAGTVSINPILFVCELFLILAWRVAGWWGVDRFILPLLGGHPKK